MKNQINTENYEAFYLDFLEGNLGQDLTLSLFAFLADNPECQVEDLGPKLVDTNLVLDGNFKNNLKPNANTMVISASNIAYFLTAEKENQLDEKKCAELDTFLIQNPEFLLDRKIYQLTTLSADKNLIFPDKKGLKQQAIFALWPFVSLLVAACAILVLWLLPNPNFSGKILSAANVSPSLVTGKKITKVKNTKGIHQKSNARAHTKKNLLKNVSYNKIAEERGKKQTVAPTKILPVRQAIVSGNLATKRLSKFNSVETFVFASIYEETTPKGIAYQKTEVSESPSSSLSLTHAMRPLTNKISDIIKTDIDYKTGENTENQRKGFYLKIGNLEISQNKKVKLKE